MSKENDLRLDGVAGDPIWAMTDGDDEHPIGLRLDSGDSGVVYLSRKQAKEIIESLVSELV